MGHAAPHRRSCADATGDVAMSTTTEIGVALENEIRLWVSPQPSGTADDRTCVPGGSSVVEPFTLAMGRKQMSQIEFECRMTWFQAAIAWWDAQTRALIKLYNSGVFRLSFVEEVA